MHLDKLQQLENNVEELYRFKQKYSLDEVRNVTTVQWALR